MELQVAAGAAQLSAKLALILTNVLCVKQLSSSKTEFAYSTVQVISLELKTDASAAHLLALNAII
jgi:hypothetical protein